MTFNLIALLPMKKNSERIKNKNFRLFHNKPFFYWILQKLIFLDEVELIVINTDYKNIMNDFDILKNKKILIRERPKEICGHDISMNKIILNDISNIDSKYYLMTHSTNPFLKINTIKQSINIFNSLDKKKFDSLFSVNKFQTRFYFGDATPINHDPNNLIPTQDLQPFYEENSNIYIFNKDSFFKNNSRIGNKPYLFQTEKIESIDIDTESDWSFAESIATLETLQD